MEVLLLSSLSFVVRRSWSLKQILIVVAGVVAGVVVVGVARSSKHRKRDFNVVLPRTHAELQQAPIAERRVPLWVFAASVACCNAELSEATVAVVN